MLMRPTVFVIGAGASYEAGFPVGYTLAKNISELFNSNLITNQPGLMAVEEISQTIHAYAIQERIRKGVIQTNAVNTDDFRLYREAARILKVGIHLSNSIDDFLHLHSDNSELQALGKLSIAYAIQNAEKRSYLRTDFGGRWLPDNFLQMASTFYTKMFKLITRGVLKRQISDIFRNCTIISFNYDRSLEFFFLHALMALYNINENEASEIMKTLAIFHPYGTVGKLPFMANNGETASYYGNILMGDPLIQVSKDIATYTEKIRDVETVERLRSAVSRCERLMFLGFGFHEQNLSLLKPATMATEREIYATAYGIPSTNLPTIRDLLSKFLPQNASWPENRKGINLSNEHTCADIFEAFYFPLGRS
ncbi:hypothetical protein [Methylobacterium sp. J-067]|uniref:hypothetical protein n=1 Tax=Methylobacterium sp. J-067 TaxID=2836648 RepID=UPI001FBA29BF|nr:hypothetical protein [Methylobacterium sp. J-067]MCJ2023381.1 hypothetical protein [Methylobacterium sp. J-067]